MQYAKVSGLIFGKPELEIVLHSFDLPCNGSQGIELVEDSL